jgi:5-methylcytosine-specific restriction endonuclease McrA
MRLGRSVPRPYRPRAVRTSQSAGSCRRKTGTRLPTSYHRGGVPKQRSASAKQQFLKRYGYKRVPSGFEVDHVAPLSQGGADAPWNMQLSPKALHKTKTARDSRLYHWRRKR